MIKNKLRQLFSALMGGYTEERLTPDHRYPFDVDRALAGDEVVTRSGLIVDNVYFNTVDNGHFIYPIRARIGDKTPCFTKEGRYYTTEMESDLDLFMSEPDEQLNILNYPKVNDGVRMTTCSTVLDYNHRDTVIQDTFIKGCQGIVRELILYNNEYKPDLALVYFPAIGKRLVLVRDLELL